MHSNYDNQLKFENTRLKETISLAKGQLEEAKLANKNNELALIDLKRELRENTINSSASLWSSEGFEALAASSQYTNPILNKFADYEATQNKILALTQLIDVPYFARIDFKFDDEDAFEKIYIGRSSLMDNTSYETYVYDWRSPIASVFYRFVIGRAFYDAPNGRIEGEINLKRQYEIAYGKLEYFFDADVQIIDEFLRKLLAQNTSSKMKTIVETIQKEQDIVIRDIDTDLMMVQGVAGSGKTSIALHRVAYLMYQGLASKLMANNIIIISPNTLFEQYISNVLPELGEDNVVSAVFEALLAKVVQNKPIQTRNQFLENLITNTKYKNIAKSSIEFKMSAEFLEILNRFIQDLPNKWIDFSDIFYNKICIVSKDTLKRKIISGRKNTPLGMKLQQLEDFVLEQIHTAYSHIDRNEIAEMKNEMRAFTHLNPQALYENLLADKKYFYSLAKGLTLPKNIEDILSYTQENLCTHYISYDDVAVITFLTLKLNRSNEYSNIKQVVIDEAQDYYPLHYEIFNLLFPNSKYTILGDINQTLEKQEDLSLYHQISKILNKRKSSLATMDKSFRCTNEILKYSQKFISVAIDIKSFNRKGHEPKVYTALNKNELMNMFVLEIAFCQKEGYESIALLCKTEKNAVALFESLKNKIDVQIVKNDSTQELKGVFIIPLYMSKGLEFDAVLICDADSKNYQSPDDKKLLYIGCTRALHRLNLFCEKEASILL